MQNDTEFSLLHITIKEMYSDVNKFLLVKFVGVDICERIDWCYAIRVIYYSYLQFCLHAIMITTTYGIAKTK